MKKLLIVRHANWNFVDDMLTTEGKKKCIDVQPLLGSFAIAISSPFGRAQETAKLLSGIEPTVDERASILKASPEFGPQIAELRKTNPYGVAGAIISIPELREPLHMQGQLLETLIKETFANLQDEQQALIVSHDGTIVALEKVLNKESFDTLDHTFGELEGLQINEEMHATRL